MLEDKIIERIAQLKRERDQYQIQANQQMAAYAGAIQALEQLLAPEGEAAAVMPVLNAPPAT